MCWRPRRGRPWPRRRSPRARARADPSRFRPRSRKVGRVHVRPADRPLSRRRHRPVCRVAPQFRHQSALVGRGQHRPLRRLAAVDRHRPASRRACPQVAASPLHRARLASSALEATWQNGTCFSPSRSASITRTEGSLSRNMPARNWRLDPDGPIVRSRRLSYRPHLRLTCLVVGGDRRRSVSHDSAADDRVRASGDRGARLG